MIIRKYQPCDCKELAELFYHTVHTVNAKDYTKQQLDVWATGKVDLEKWDRSFQEHYSIVAVDHTDNHGLSHNLRYLRRRHKFAVEKFIFQPIITGFGDINDTGYLDRLYVHADYQGKGVATAICDKLEHAVQGKIVTHASITAKPFFEKRGYKVIKEQQVERNGIFLTNFVMEKA